MLQSVKLYAPVLEMFVIFTTKPDMGLQLQP